MMRQPDLAPALAVAASQVAADRVPFVILAAAGAEGVGRVEVVPPRDGPRIGANAVCLLASVTKPIVATAVMRLAQEGRFPLTVPLARWLPELAAAGPAPFTAWHVLTHTTGITDVDLVDVLVGHADRAELLRRTIAGGQAWPPGSRFQYASFTFDLLAEALERALDRPFEEILRATVLDPLGMVDTTFDAERAGARRASVRLGDWEGTSHAVPAGMDAAALVDAYASLRLAGGGLWSTAGDLLRFGRAMLRGGELDGERVLGRPLVDLMTREVTVDGLGSAENRLAAEHYAIGWGKPGPADPASPLAFAHGGMSGTRLVVDPAYDLVLVYLSGEWGGAAEAINEVVLATYGTFA